MKNAGFAHGWLITAGEDGSFNLLNPSTQTQIALPPVTNYLTKCVSGRFHVQSQRGDLLTVKTPRSLIGPSGDYTVALTHKGDDHYVLSFCRSTDEKWSVLDRYLWW